jgi:hypothetical protein
VLRSALAALVGTCLALTAPFVLEAQASPDSASANGPYSRLRFRVSGALIVNHEPIHDFWRSQTGGSVRIATPFYIGSIGIGATLVPFRARDAQRPDFRALMLGIDWGGVIPVPGPIRIGAAARVGDFVMLIENPNVWLDSESELLAGGEVSASLPLRRDLAVTATGSFARVFTRPSLDVALVTVGLEYVARTPGWLRAFLE